MKWKRFSVGTLLFGSVSLLIGPFSPMIYWNTAPDTVGGADMPTYWFLASHVMKGWPIFFALLGAALVVTGLVCLFFPKAVKTHCTGKTSAIAAGISAVGAAGLGCAFLCFVFLTFHETAKHPISYPAALGLGALCLGLLVWLLTLYCGARKTGWTAQGVLLDILTAVLYFPAFFYGFSCLYETVSTFVCGGVMT